MTTEETLRILILVAQLAFVGLLYLVLFAAGLFLLKPFAPADVALAARFSRRAGVVVGQLVGNRAGD